MIVTGDLRFLTFPGDRLLFSVPGVKLQLVKTVATDQGRHLGQQDDQDLQGIHPWPQGFIHAWFMHARRQLPSDQGRSMRPLHVMLVSLIVEGHN